jgi:hypothetical protein
MPGHCNNVDAAKYAIPSCCRIFRFRRDPEPPPNTTETAVKAASSGAPRPIPGATSATIVCVAPFRSTPNSRPSIGCAAGSVTSASGGVRLTGFEWQPTVLSVPPMLRVGGAAVPDPLEMLPHSGGNLFPAGISQSALELFQREVNYIVMMDFVRRDFAAQFEPDAVQ